MKVGDRCDKESLLVFARVEIESTFGLADQIHGAICDIPLKNAVVSLAATMANIILSIECPGCRRLHAEAALKTTKTALQEAIVEAAKHTSRGSHHCN